MRRFSAIWHSLSHKERETRIIPQKPLDLVKTQGFMEEITSEAGADQALAEVEEGQIGQFAKFVARLDI